MPAGQRKPFHVRHVDEPSDSEAEYDTQEAAVADMNARNARASAMGLRARYLVEPTPPGVAVENPRSYASLYGGTVYPAYPERLTLTEVAEEPVLLRMTFGIPERPLMAYSVSFTASFGDGMGYLVWEGHDRPVVGRTTYVEWGLPELFWNRNCRPASSAAARIWVQDGRTRLITLVEGIETVNGNPVRFDLGLRGETLHVQIRDGHPALGDWIEIDTESIELWPEDY